MLLLGVIQAQASGAVAAGSFDLLETQVLSSSAASVTFSSLDTYAAQYQHLQIRYTARAVYPSNDRGAVSLRINGDTGSNYNSHALYATGSSVSSLAPSASYMVLYDLPFGGVGNEYAGGVVDVLDPFSSNKNTTVRTFAGYANFAGFNRMALNSGLWRNTAQVTSLNFFPDGASFHIGSRFSLYGIKAA